MGGGSPVFVEFYVQDEAKEMLQTLGLRVGKDGLTERVEFLTASPERIFVVSQREETMSFESNLVKASKFYTVNYYVSADAHFTTGEWYFCEDQWDIAIQEYSKAILIQADMVDAWKGRGVAYLEKYALSPEDNSLYSNALSDLTKALELLEGDQKDAQFAYVHYERGRLHFLKAVQLKKEGASDESDKELKESYNDLREAFDKDPLLIDSALLETAFKDNILESDNNKFRMVLEDPEGGIIVERYASLASTYSNEGRFDEASYAYEMASILAFNILKDDKLSARYHCMRARILEEQSKNNEALDEWKEAVKLDETKPDYHYGLAKLSYRTGAVDEAHSECQQELIDPFEEEKLEFSHEIADCYIIIGNIARDSEDFDSATQCYEEAAKLSKENGLFTTEASAYFDRARLEARRRNINEALNYLESAVWLDRSYGEKAESEHDFELCREQNRYRQVISPPIILRVMSSEEDRTITIVIQESVDDFLISLAGLSRILDFPVLVTPEGGGLAQSYSLSEDGLNYKFQLAEDTWSDVSKLAETLRGFLRLSE
jgi:tetratricopeptide (TPR) repeat protein